MCVPSQIAPPFRLTLCASVHHAPFKLSIGQALSYSWSYYPALGGTIVGFVFLASCIYLEGRSSTNWPDMFCWHIMYPAYYTLVACPAFGFNQIEALIFLFESCIKYLTRWNYRFANFAFTWWVLDSRSNLYAGLEVHRRFMLGLPLLLPRCLLMAVVI